MSNIQCHYDVLSVSRDADDTTIKKAYRKLALKWHPDKNIGVTEKEANVQFRLIQAAYECLSDSTERKWYDEHREMILRGIDPDDDEIIVSSYMFVVLPFFHSSCYNGYNEDPDGYFAVYSNVFLKIYEGEERGYNDQQDESFYSKRKNNSNVERNFWDYVSFGNEKTEWKDVCYFYATWENFSSCLNYAWVDVYDTRLAENRRVRRAMEDENKKARRKAKKNRNEEITSLIQFVKRRDPRIEAYKVKLEREKISKMNEKKKELEKKKIDLATARESWKIENERYMNQYLEDDLKAGRIRLDDLTSDEDSYYKKKKKKNKRKKKGRKNVVIIDDSNSSSSEPKDLEETIKQELNQESSSFWKCESCMIDTFESEEQFEIHCRTEEHLKNWNINSVDKNDFDEIILESSSGSETPTKQIWHCEYCNKKFKTENQFKNHLKSKKHLETLKKKNKKK